MSAKNPAELVNIVLKAPHSHGGIIRKAGEVISVTDRQALWLIDRGIGAALAASYAKPKPKPKPKPKKSTEE